MDNQRLFCTQWPQETALDIEAETPLIKGVIFQSLNLVMKPSELPIPRQHFWAPCQNPAYEYLSINGFETHSVIQPTKNAFTNKVANSDMDG